MSANIVMVVKYVVSMFLNQQTLKDKNLDEDTLLLFRTTFNAKGHFNLVCCAEQSLESEAQRNNVFSKLLSDLKLRFTMVVIHYNL